MSASLPLGRCIFFIKTQSFNLIIDSFLNLLISNVCSTMDTFQKAQLNFTRTRTSKLLRRVVLLFVSFLATRKCNLRYNVKQSFLRIYVPFFYSDRSLSLELYVSDVCSTLDTIQEHSFIYKGQSFNKRGFAFGQLPCH